MINTTIKGWRHDCIHLCTVPWKSIQTLRFVTLQPFVISLFKDLCGAPWVLLKATFKTLP